MEAYKEQMASEWGKDNERDYLKLEVASLKEDRSDIVEKLRLLDQELASGKISREEYLEEMKELLKDLNETNAKIDAIESVLNGNSKIGVASTEGNQDTGYINADYTSNDPITTTAGDVNDLAIHSGDQVQGAVTEHVAQAAAEHVPQITGEQFLIAFVETLQHAA